MIRRHNRRQFLRDLAGWSTAVGAVSATMFDPAAVTAIEPIPRNGVPNFKFSLAAYSYRGLLAGDAPELTLADFITDCARMQLEGTELTSYYFPNPVTNEYLRQLKQQCFRLGLGISGTAVGNDFGHPAGPKRQQQIDLVKRWVDYSEILGAPVIRIFAGQAKPDSTASEAHSRMVAAMEECCQYAGQHGVHLALENHGGPTSTADGMLAFVRDVKSPWFGVNLDTGNFHGGDIYRDLARLAPYALNVQVKVEVSGPGGQSEPADFARMAKILRDVAYRGYIVLEYEEAGDPRTECPRFMEPIREAFA